MQSVEMSTKANWFVEKLKRYKIITFYLFLLLIYRYSQLTILYFVNKKSLSEIISGIDSKYFFIGFPIVYFLQWLLVVSIASKFPKDILKKKFYDHPIATLIFVSLYLIDIPFRLRDSIINFNIFYSLNILEYVTFYAFLNLLWWLLICWVSSKVFKKQRLQWLWYKKIIDKMFVIIPNIFKVVLALTVSFIIAIFLFLLLSLIFKYSGQDLKKILA